MYILTIGFFKTKLFFLRKELDNKQKPIEHLLSIINNMHTNPNKSGENFYKNSNAQPVQHSVKSVHIRSFFWSLFSCTRIEYGQQ